MPIIDERARGVKELAETSRVEGVEFHFDSRFVPTLSDAQFRRIAAVNEDPERLKKLLAHEKNFPLAEAVALKPDLESMKEARFVDLLRARRSCREFSGAAVSFTQISNLLTLAYGCLDKDEPLHRTAPSAGGRMPIEIYAVAVNTEELRPGVYHFHARKAVLQALKHGGREEVCRWLALAGFAAGLEIERVGLVLIMTAVFHRTIGKYGKRGWRFIYEDAGHVGQNIGLAVEALGLAGTAWGGGFDADVARLLGFDETEEGLVLSYVVGAKV